jgi:hypothetical protein
VKISFKILVTGTIVFLMAACHNSSVKQKSKPDSSHENQASEKFGKISSLHDTVGLLKLFKSIAIIKNVAYYRDSSGVLIGDAINAIMKMPIKQQERYVVLFVSSRFDSIGKPGLRCFVDPGIVSMAEVDNIDGVYRVTGFSSHFDSVGANGNPGQFSLEKFGTENYLLHISSAVEGQGEVYGLEEYFDIPKCDKVFEMDNYDNEDAWGANDKDFKKIEREIKNIPMANTQYDDLEVTTTITRYNTKTRRNYSVISKKYYHMDDRANKYKEFKK